MKVETLNLNSARSLIPERDPFGHKGTFGKVLLLCGSRGYTGAPWFAAMGALRSGTGLVFLGVPESIYEIEAVKLNEPVLFPLPEETGMFSEEAIPQAVQRLEQVQAVLIGCGMGKSQGTLELCKAVLETAKCPVIVDADGINVLSGHKDILRRRSSPTILTPHDMEFKRLGGELTGDRMESASQLARDLESVVVLKGHETCITDGSRGYLNKTGNSGLAKGGSGDILAGLITGLAAQGMEPLEAAACGVFYHGAAADLCAEEMGEYGMLPSDCLRFLPRLLR